MIRLWRKIFQEKCVSVSVGGKIGRQVLTFSLGVRRERGTVGLAVTDGVSISSRILANLSLSAS